MWQAKTLLTQPFCFEFQYKVCTGFSVMQAAEFHHVRWPPHHSRHRSAGGGDLLRSDTKSSTPTGAPSMADMYVGSHVQQREKFSQ